MSPRERLAVILRKNWLIPVIAIEDAGAAVPLAQALVAGGVTTLEVTLRTAAAADAIGRIVREVPQATVGVGTIRSADDVERAVDLGAQFGVSPGTTPKIYAACAAANLPLLPGAATASEILLALEHGCEIVKFFPAVPAGGIAAIKALRGPFPSLQFCPTGGINEANLSDWLAVPGVIAIGGSWLAPDDKVRARDWDAITDIARRSRARRATIAA
ncbi:MAG TPA: bifunctional 4-hydroxy-2-oxoglutarate aldolase/2-dehydro-3-deoxy-phosphogluconate aldolase [Hyphomicrobiaceae bacterium]|jgi:2-dehydro-3-deoxyphosphogluconate aldolase/(4S)-4-hydroxy-2-oxoglutarate aldolase|nr:bifunctional 4-hydroxy-2-oxoglutarate aldolase/2-dehydro-3-deoxy-phosphogluconate aldolase [Hyphomicrobiaceae bacterium]